MDFKGKADNWDVTDAGENWQGGRSRRMGAMVQLAVFLSGLFFTLITSAALNISVSAMLAEDNRRLLADTQQTISDNLIDLEQSIRTVSAIIYLSESTNDADWKKRVIYAVPHLKKFDHVLLVQKDAAGRWQRREILTSENAPQDNIALLAPGAEDDLANRVVGPNVLNLDYTAFVGDLPESPTAEYPPRISITERPIIFAHVMNPANPGAGIVIGVSRVTNIAGPEWLANRPVIERIVVTDATATDVIFDMNRNSGAQHQRMMIPDDKSFEFRLGNDKLGLYADPGLDTKAYFLEQIPLLMLLAGLLLTGSATMFVRNKQKHEQRLTAVNTILARKNEELGEEVSERARLNNILTRAERENKAIIDSISDIIFETTTDGEIVFLNKAWEKITGFKIEQTKDRVLFDLLHPQDQEEQRKNFEQMVRGQKPPYRVMTRIRNSNGSFRAVEMSISMLRQDENRNTRVLGAMTDVEERRRAERALLETEKKYRTIVENAAGGIYQVTPDGQYLSANPAMARILGYDSAEQILRQVKNAHQEIYADRAEHNRFVDQLRTLGVANNFETRVRARNGKEIWINENARSVKDDEGNILYFEGSMEDISPRKEIEIKLKEAKIQSDLASRAKSEFLANMSHELRTPLNAIIGFSEIIKNEVLGPLGNKQYWEYSRDIYDSGKGLLKIISEILEISRIETGDRQITESLVDIGKVSKSCVDFLSQRAQDGKLTVTNNLVDAPNVVGEELAVKQIVLNLLSNAIKFTPAGGQITLSHEIDAEGQLRVSITDTGIGLDEKEIEKALSPFGQIDSALSRKGSGTGLGLTLVDSMIRLHGGRLELFSQKGLGTTATVIFPAKIVQAR